MKNLLLNQTFCLLWHYCPIWDENTLFFNFTNFWEKPNYFQNPHCLKTLEDELRIQVRVSNILFYKYFLKYEQYRVLAIYARDFLNLTKHVRWMFHPSPLPFDKQPNYSIATLCFKLFETTVSVVPSLEWKFGCSVEKSPVVDVLFASHYKLFPIGQI